MKKTKTLQYVQKRNQNELVVKIAQLESDKIAKCIENTALQTQIEQLKCEITNILTKTNQSQIVNSV